MSEHSDRRICEESAGRRILIASGCSADAFASQERGPPCRNNRGKLSQKLL